MWPVGSEQRPVPARILARVWRVTSVQGWRVTSAPGSAPVPVWLVILVRALAARSAVSVIWQVVSVLGWVRAPDSARVWPANLGLSQVASVMSQAGSARVLALVRAWPATLVPALAAPSVISVRV